MERRICVPDRKRLGNIQSIPLVSNQWEHFSEPVCFRSVLLTSRQVDDEELVIAQSDVLLEDWLRVLADEEEHHVSLEDSGVRIEIVMRWIPYPFEVSIRRLWFFRQMLRRLALRSRNPPLRRRGWSLITVLIKRLRSPTRIRRVILSCRLLRSGP